MLSFPSMFTYSCIPQPLPQYGDGKAFVVLLFENNWPLVASDSWSCFPCTIKCSNDIKNVYNTIPLYHAVYIYIVDVTFMSWFW